jgi:hypothetical protein
MRDLAPGWIIRCTKCGQSKPLGQTGAIRLGAASRGKWTLAWCNRCGWLRIAAIERMPEGAKSPGIDEPGLLD